MPLLFSDADIDLEVGRNIRKRKMDVRKASRDLIGTHIQARTCKIVDFELTDVVCRSGSKLIVHDGCTAVGNAAVVPRSSSPWSACAGVGRRAELRSDATVAPDVTTGIQWALVQGREGVARGGTWGGAGDQWATLCVGYRIRHGRVPTAEADIDVGQEVIAARPAPCISVEIVYVSDRE